MIRRIFKCITLAAFSVVLSCAQDGGTNVPDTNLPSAPTALVANKVSSSRVDLSWNPSVDDTGVAMYAIYRDDVHIANTTSASYTDTDIGNNIYYCYEVEASDASQNTSNRSGKGCAFMYGRTFNGMGHARASSICNTSDGGVAIAGYTFSDFRINNAYVIKLDASGNTVWETTFGGDGGSHVQDIKQTPDGGFIVTGSTDSGTNRYVYIAKMDSNGALIWENSFGEPGNNFGTAIIYTSDGGYALYGRLVNYSEHAAPPTTNYAFLAKTDPSGDLEWQVKFDMDIFNNIIDYKVIQADDGGYVLSMVIRGLSFQFQQALLIKTNSLGEVQWEKNISTNCLTIQALSDGSYIFLGTNSGDIVLSKIDESDNVLWEYTYDTIPVHFDHLISMTIDGGYIIIGTIYGASWQWDISIAWFNSFGSPLWDLKFPGAEPDRAYAMAQKLNGSFAMLVDSPLDNIYLMEVDFSGGIVQ